MKSKIAGIAMIFLLVVPTMSALTYLHYQKSLVRKEVRERLSEGTEHEDLVLLALSDAEIRNELQWEHDDEFEYRGQMYDVVETESLGDTTYYLCWKDHEETELKEHINELIAKALINNTHNKKYNDTNIQFIKKLYCTNFNEFSPGMQGQTAGFIASEDHFTGMNPVPPVPPPRYR